MNVEPLSRPFEELDAGLAGLFDAAPLPVAIVLAVALGLRHASDPDHLVAVTSVVAAEHGDARAAVRLGAWWGLGHALTLVCLGVPLIAFKAGLPGALERGAEVAIGVVIVALAARVGWKWARGEYRAGAHMHERGAAPGAGHRHLHRAAEPHDHRRARGPREALALGFLHGLAGTGAVVVLLIAALPSQLEAAAALAAFAPMSVVSMAALSGAFAWALTRPAVEPLYRAALIPALSLSGIAFGLSYAALA